MEDDPLMPHAKDMDSSMYSFHVRSLAEQLLVMSVHQDGGLPTISIQEAFATAEAFYSEAVRRGH